MVLKCFLFAAVMIIALQLSIQEDGEEDHNEAHEQMCEDSVKANNSFEASMFCVQNSTMPNELSLFRKCFKELVGVDTPSKAVFCMKTKKKMFGK